MSAILQEAYSKNDIYRSRIAAIVDRIMEEDEIYREEGMDRTEIIEYLIDLMQTFSPDKFNAIANNDLTKRIRRIMATELASGMLNDLTPEQMKIYDEATTRR